MKGSRGITHKSSVQMLPVAKASAKFRARFKARGLWIESGKYAVYGMFLEVERA